MHMYIGASSNFADRDVGDSIRVHASLGNILAFSYTELPHAPDKPHTYYTFYTDTCLGPLVVVSFPRFGGHVLFFLFFSDPQLAENDVLPWKRNNIDF